MKQSLFMKSLLVLSCVVFLLNNLSPAQTRLGPSGSCAVSERGTLDCDWTSAIDIRKPSPEVAARERETALKVSQYPTTQSKLAPGASVDATSESYDCIVVALSEGYLVNEAKQTDGNLLLRSGEVILLSKGDKHLLRNAGNTNLSLLFITMKK